MSKISITPNASGTGVFTISSPATNTDRSLTLPDEAGTVLTSAGVPASAMPAGSVIQVVNHRNSSLNSTTSSSFVATNSTATITPTSATSKILIITNAPLYMNTDNGHVYVTIYRNSTNLNPANNELQLFSAGTASAGRWTNGSMSFLDSPATTSAVTYTVYLRSGGTGTAHYDANGGMAVITLMEIAG